MNMPINIADVLNIATDMKEVRDTTLSVSLVIDPTAEPEISAHVRAAFASEAPNTRVRINYIDDPGVFEAERVGDDIAVLVAGENELIGELAFTCRSKGVPTMVITDDGELVSFIAQENGYPIPAADIIMPVKLVSSLEENLLSRLPKIEHLYDKYIAKFLDVPDDIAVVGDDSHTSEVDVTLDRLAILDNRIGKWIITVCKQKDLAFAYSFPFIRRPLARESINMTSLQNGAIGAVPFLPGADMPVMTLNQVKMALQIATAYGQPLDKERIKEIVAVVAGAFVCRHFVRSIVKVIPAIGPIASGGVGYIATFAMGHALLEYFEAGGDIVGAANVLQSARDVAVSSSSEFSKSKAGRAIIGKLRTVDLSKLINKQ